MNRLARFLGHNNMGSANMEAVTTKHLIRYRAETCNHAGQP
jgi:hypothetical protein